MKKPILTLAALYALFVITLYADDAGRAVPGAASTLKEIFASGGAVMWLLLATSMVGLTFALERAVSLRRAVHLPFELAEHVFWLRENEGVANAMAYAEKSRSTLGRVLTVILSHYQETRQENEQAVEGELARVLADERRNLRPVGIAGTIAPLMGLLGTVLGMIDAFRQAAASGMDNPANFAGGIYQALYTTAFGLLISIILLLLYHWLRGRTEQLLRAVEDKALGFLHQEFYCEAPITVIAEDVDGNAA